MLKINFIELVHIIGSFPETVDKLSSIINITNIYVQFDFTPEIKIIKDENYQNLDLMPRLRFIQNHNIYDEYTKKPKDECAFHSNFGRYSYGYLRTKKSYIILYFQKIKTIDDLIYLFDIANKKREEMRLKNIDIDPYGEDDWVDENIIISFNSFIKNH